KSFADRTVLRLEPGITSIVGPNGCGKSNILDAMRWALGEQSPKALRGSHMQDVIFNGSENRQATGMAEVSLTFDNADSRLPVDFAEVEVTRRVYRSGESEYLINKAPCRLRDVQELFMDTGIGMSAYSLIGQGKIAMVLSSKPEDRRFVFEEAAGIIKYKARKRAAMKRLDDAAQNLLRLSDIIAEVQHQMRRLKRQVNAAIRYRELTTALKEIEIRAAWLKYTALTEEAKQLRKGFAKAQDAFEKASAQTSQLDARREELSLKRIEFERVLAARRESASEVDAEMEKIERSIALVRQQIEFSRNQQQQALDEHTEFLQRAADIADQIERTEAERLAMAELTSEQQAAQIAKQQEHEKALQSLAAAEAALENVRARSLDAVNVRAKTQTELDTLDVTIANIETQLAAIYTNQETQNQRNEVLLAQLEEAQQREAGKQAELTQTVEQRRATAEAHAAKMEAMRTLNEEWQHLREKHGRDESRLHSLRELRDSYEGFATGVRAIMKAKQKDIPEAKGIIGPAGDLISTDKTYEHAIEAVLGGNVNNVIVERADDAKDAIGFLNKHQAGRVTFLPLDTIRVGQHDDTGAVRGKKGVIGPAINYVQHDAHIDAAVQYLLYNTVIVETIDDAIRIARHERLFPRLVTLEGEVVSSSGAVTGGRTKNESRGLLGRSAEIAELEDAVKKAKNRIAEMGKQGQTLTVEIQNLAQQVKAFETAEQGMRRELNEVGVVIARYTTELETVTQSAQQLAKQRDGLCARRDGLQSQRVAALERVTSIESDDEALQRELAEAQNAASQARQTLSVCAGEMTDLRVKLAELRQGLDAVARGKIRESQDRENALREAERRKEQAAQHKENEATLENDVAANIERIKALSEDKDVAQQKVVAAQNDLQKVLDEVESLNKGLREKHERTLAAREEVHKYEMELRHAEDQIEFFGERILTEYHVGLASLKAEDVGTDEYDEETREGLVIEYRDKIERM
ncbi:MAG: chromosome segregation protein, partial [Candidatus Hydrogenedentes bacterium]|nr:chromosome segregation protein [Candidatus Hydrogenedentota bacterium]